MDMASPERDVILALLSSIPYSSSGHCSLIVVVQIGSVITSVLRFPGSVSTELL